MRVPAGPRRRPGPGCRTNIGDGRHGHASSFGPTADHRGLGLKYNGGWNDFYSSGQIPLDEVTAGRLDRFGYVDPFDGGRVRNGTAGAYFRQEDEHGGVFKVDGFVTRSLFDLYSNFTFFLNDPLRGDAVQQHDSRLVQGANAQYQRPHKVFGLQALITAGAWGGMSIAMPAGWWSIAMM